MVVDLGRSACRRHLSLGVLVNFATHNSQLRFMTDLSPPSFAKASQSAVATELAATGMLLALPYRYSERWHGADSTLQCPKSWQTIPQYLACRSQQSSPVKTRARYPAAEQGKYHKHVCRALRTFCQACLPGNGCVSCQKYGPSGQTPFRCSERIVTKLSSSH